MGLIASAMRGVGEAGLGLTKQAGDYLARSSLQEEAAKIAELRDARLNEYARQRDIEADDRRRAPFKAAQAEVDSGKGGLVDDLSGTVRPRTESEERQRESGVYRKHGLIDSALRMEDSERQRERDIKSDLARTRDDNRADEQLEETKRVNTATIEHQQRQSAIAAGNSARAQKLVDEQIKDLGLARTLKELQITSEQEKVKYRNFANTETDPVKRAQYREAYQLLIGKDNDNFVVTVDKEKDITGTEVVKGLIKTDKRTGAVTYQAMPDLRGEPSSGAYKSAEEVRAAHRSGKIDRATAIKELGRFGYK